MSNLAKDITAQPKLSNPSKMPGKSWSLQAGSQCIGKKIDGVMDPVCSDCYAQKGRYEFANVTGLREHNRVDATRAGWVDAMVKLIGKRKYFRWFDSGDINTRALADQILEVMERTPDTKHWLPTRTARVETFRPILAKMEALPNVVVRHSAWGYDNMPESFGPNGSMVYTGTKAPAGVLECEAYKTASGTCRKAGCFKCWDKEAKVIGYPAH